MVIYHNPRCRKSRETLELIQNTGKVPEIVEYLKNPLSKMELKDVLSKLGKKAEDIIRKNESEFKDNYKDKTLTEDDYLDMMVKFPKLMERPIVVEGNKAVIGRPPEKVMSILN